MKRAGLRRMLEYRRKPIAGGSRVRGQIPLDRRTAPPRSVLHGPLLLGDCRGGVLCTGEVLQIRSLNGKVLGFRGVRRGQWMRYASQVNPLLTPLNGGESKDPSYRRRQLDQLDLRKVSLR